MAALVKILIFLAGMILLMCLMFINSVFAAWAFFGLLIIAIFADSNMRKKKDM